MADLGFLREHYWELSNQVRVLLKVHNDLALRYYQVSGEEKEIVEERRRLIWKECKPKWEEKIKIGKKLKQIEAQDKEEEEEEEEEEEKEEEEEEEEKEEEDDEEEKEEEEETEEEEEEEEEEDEEEKEEEEEEEEKEEGEGEEKGGEEEEQEQEQPALYFEDYEGVDGSPHEALLLASHNYIRYGQTSSEEQRKHGRSPAFLWASLHTWRDVGYYGKVGNIGCLLSLLLMGSSILL